MKILYILPVFLISIISCASPNTNQRQQQIIVDALNWNWDELLNFPRVNSPFSKTHDTVFKYLRQGLPVPVHYAKAPAFKATVPDNERLFILTDAEGLRARSSSSSSSNPSSTPTVIGSSISRSGSTENETITPVSSSRTPNSGSYTTIPQSPSLKYPILPLYPASFAVQNFHSLKHSFTIFQGTSSKIGGLISNLLELAHFTKTDLSHCGSSFVLVPFSTYHTNLVQISHEVAANVYFVIYKRDLNEKIEKLSEMIKNDHIFITILAIEISFPSDSFAYLKMLFNNNYIENEQLIKSALKEVFSLKP